MIFFYISIYFWLFQIILSFLEKKRQNNFKILKNHCDLIYCFIWKFLVPKCSENQMHLENYPKSVMGRGRGVESSKMADK